MRKLILVPDGARVIDAMVLSCGNIADCETMRRRLGHIRVNVPLEAVGQNENGVWFAPFRRLYEFAASQNPPLERIDGYAAVRNFAGDAHAQHVLHSGSYAKFGAFLGQDLGVLTHVALVLDKDGVYRNSGKAVKFQNFVDLGGKGTAVYHLGVVVRLPLSPEQIKEIKSEQRSSEVFWETLDRVDGKAVKLQEEQIKAIEAEAKAGR